jgi:hemerythrin-like domain-containing protein
MNNSLQILYDEHEVISQAVAIARNARVLIGINDEEYDFKMRELISFFRIYADRYHHQKEEEILFPEMMKKNELMADGIIKEMFDNHENFRELLRSIESSVENKEYKAAADLIEEYTNALLDHIAVENDELFQTAYSLFNDIELENIYYRFADLDRELGEEKKKVFADIK